jgi:hypothetical protein
VFSEAYAFYSYCPENSVCGSPAKFGLSQYDDGIYSNEEI